ncbi:deoxyribonuclease-1 [Plakobranchus ocellatus]|uniref:Deoxyribonuclease n=1 Tax=Plakobranchus ocellatus TaxID=259542 RepID=A0AAV4B980_9GAST|nr:deoxyribonuclease-1 [Plakobranchus ocellatus]
MVARHESFPSFLLYSLKSFLLLGLVQDSTSFIFTNTPEYPLRVASFNIRRFGLTVVSRPAVLSNIVRIIKRYDVVFVQETRDKSLASVDTLRAALGEAEWEYTASSPVGRGTYKEQYVYFYRPAVVKLLHAYLYNDSRDAFEREPYIVQFLYWSPAASSNVKVTLVGAHLTPDDVPNELEALTEVISQVKGNISDSQGIVTMGDFNADCNYLNGAERGAATLFNTPSEYTSFLRDTSDSTVSHKQDCAYDRLVLTEQGQRQVKVANVKAFDFEKGLGINYEAAYALSDHYPIEFSLL